MKQVNIVIEELFHRISDEEMSDTLDTFWSEYNAFHYKNYPFDDDVFIWSNKYIREGNSHIWNQKYYIPCKKVLGFVVCRIKFKIISIGAD